MLKLIKRSRDTTPTVSKYGKRLDGSYRERQFRDGDI
jgi:hypothetical protein